VSQWLVLVYRIPREPTAGRVYVWRKLKQLGALAWQDAVWILPAAPRTQEHVQWLAAEITELGGEALLFSSDLLFDGGAEKLVARFEQPVREAYEEIAQALRRKDADRAALSKRFQQIQAQDYFHCDAGVEVRAKLLAPQGDDAR
jgi:23S rRNA C2498 (ribose-2'-O)-methylase RlmM